MDPIASSTSLARAEWERFTARSTPRSIVKSHSRSFLRRWRRTRIAWSASRGKPKTLASLNHPNIAQIHGFEQSGDSRALVMELVHGEDLSRRCARGAIPLDEALAIARQICAALDAAHERGVIHRDLKPANIKLRDDGTVKVLDFGLAKAVQPGSAVAVEADAEVDHLPSATISASGVSLPGSIVGTAAYMSPEQARGKAVDGRADIWAFGCVLYEMLAGVRAFRGSDLATIVSNVLTTEPDWSALPAGTPASIRRLLSRCLQKDPARRLRHIGDAALEMEDSLTQSRLEEVALPAAHSENRTGSLRMLRLTLMTGVLVVSAAGLFALSLSGRRAPKAAEMRLEISTLATDNLPRVHFEQASTVLTVFAVSAIVVDSAPSPAREIAPLKGVTQND